MGRWLRVPSVTPKNNDLTNLAASSGALTC